MSGYHVCTLLCFDSDSGSGFWRSQDWFVFRERERTINKRIKSRSRAESVSVWTEKDTVLGNDYNEANLYIIEIC